MRVIFNVIQFILQIQRQTAVCFLIIYLSLLKEKGDILRVNKNEIQYNCIIYINTVYKVNIVVEMIPSTSR